jgi:hypothetical protein
VFQLVKSYFEIADEIAKTFSPFYLVQMDARDRWKAGVSTKFLGGGSGIK